MNNYTFKLQTEYNEKLYEFFRKEECNFTEQQYAFFKANSKNYNAIFYKSGKLVLQGKDITEIIKKITLNFNLKFKDTEKEQTEEITETNYIGIDESGKGDFFGPLIIAGVAVNDNLKKIFSEIGIKDSKQISDEKILKLAKEIQKQAKWSIVTINPTKYNELYTKFKNLNKLLAWGHARAIENVLEKAPECKLAISDKFAKDNKVIENALLTNGKKIKLIQRIKGEEDIAVAAASIIARAKFVESIKFMSHLYKIDFPKGASERVIEEAKKYITKYGKEKLNEVAKLHFKTTEKL